MLLEIIVIIIGYIIGYHGPDSNIIRKYIYHQDGKYYKFTPEVCVCID